MMTLKDMVDAALLFVSQWCGTTAPRFISVLVGIVIGVVTVTALWERRLRAATAVFLLVAGALLIAVGLDTQVLHWLAATDYLTRIRLLMGFLSLFVLTVTLEAIRRNQLMERYALLWVATGLIVLLCAFFPEVLRFFTVFLGVQYVTAVVAVVFTFLVLVAFHFSIILSAFHDNQTRIAQRCALLEARLDQLAAEVAALKGFPPPAPAPQPDVSAASREEAPPKARRWRGSFVAIPIVILAATVAVLVVGLSAPQAMIGDEVTHYYLLTHQERTWPAPDFRAAIPMGWGDMEWRAYPHTSLWHYLGAGLGRFIGHSFALIQVYHTLFWLQFLVAAFYLGRGRDAGNRRSVLLFLIILASLPMGLIFSVAFYQDVPVAAQVLTAFCLLDRRRWFLGSVFMALALGMKETAVLFLPAFLVFFVWRLAGAPAAAATRAWRRVAGVGLPLVLAGGVVAASMGVTTWALRSRGYGYYPVDQLHQAVRSLQHVWAAPRAPAGGGAVANPKPEGLPPVTAYEVEIIANHPGDLRRPVNFIVYGGALLWGAILLGLAGWVRSGRPPAPEEPGRPVLWPLWVGLSYCLPLAYVLRTAPDARFFLPGIPFLLLPFCQGAVRLSRARVVLSVFAAVAILQGGQVLAKTYQLRRVSADLGAAIRYLQANPPEPRRVFMYPEGNYRLFPVPHDWYLSYHLREFWKTDNDGRIACLQKYGIGAIVIKKHLVGPVDEKITDLGVYPDYFVRDIGNDPRFHRVFDNPAAAIYLVPNTEKM